MRIGIDLDNTIVCYDAVFHQAAVARGLIGPDGPVQKEAIRSRLRDEGREDDWTELQGHAYGAGMADADPFPGALEFFEAARRSGVAISIVSHRTRTPYRGPPHDLHAAARAWLARRGFVGERTGLSSGDVFLEESKQGKLERIAAAGCTQFVDDLPELLAEPGFPAGVERLLFDPSGRHAQRAGPWKRIGAWSEAGVALGIATLFRGD